MLTSTLNKAMDMYSRPLARSTASSPYAPCLIIPAMSLTEERRVLVLLSERLAGVFHRTFAFSSLVVVVEDGVKASMEDGVVGTGGAAEGERGD